MGILCGINWRAMSPGRVVAASRTAVISWGVFSHGNVNADFERVTWRRGAPTCRRHAR
jgi:hypothetical protein